MSTILPYFLQYFKTNHFTASLVIFLVALTAIKYFRIKISIKSGVLFWLILILGLALRLGWLCYSSHVPQTAWNAKHMLESDVANVHAIELTKGIWFHLEDGKPAFRRPIGYPLFLGLIYKIFGVHAWAGWGAHLVLFALTAWLFYRMTQLLFSEKTALLASFFLAIFPISIYSVKLMTDEHLFLPLWFWGLYWLLKEIKGKPVKGALIWYGVIFGLATMTRTHTIFMPFVVALAYALIKKPWKKVLAAFLIVAALMQVVNLPWIVRNYRIWKVPALYTLTGCELSVWLNSNAGPEMPGANPKLGEPGYSPELEQAVKDGNEGLAHLYGRRSISRWVSTHPKEFTVLGISRLLIFMGWNRKGIWPIWFQFYPGSFDTARPIPQGLKDALEEYAYHYYYVLLFSFIFALIFIFRRRRQFSREEIAALGVIGACFLFWWGGQMAIFPERKYRYPLEILMIACSSYFWTYLLDEFRWEKILKRAR